MTAQPPRVRFAPSPTGALHIGGARTALYNWLIARGRGGTLVLRIEDTDRERSTPENVEQILDALRWLELDWDEGPLSQAERSARHRERIDELLASGRAYPDPATGEEVRAWKEANGNRGYRGEPRPGEGAAVRLRVPDEGVSVVDDVIRGEVRFENRLTDDFVIARGDGTPLYNFAVAVDDAEMGITDVVRGDDHLSNTPKQLLVLEALGFDPPRYAHLPLLHGPDGKKLSKRHGAASVQELRDQGYLPAAVRNYLALLGWGTDDDTTILSTEELVERFAIERVGRASAIFDEKKLRWLNGRFMRELELDRYVDAVAAPPRPRRPRRGGGRSRGAAGRVRDRAGEGADARRGLAADPLPVRGSGRRREGAREMADRGDGAGARGGAGRARADRRSRVGGGAARGGARARGRAARGQGTRRSTSRCVSPSPGRPSRPGSSRRSRRSGASGRSSASPPPRRRGGRLRAGPPRLRARRGRSGCTGAKQPCPRCRINVQTPLRRLE